MNCKYTKSGKKVAVIGKLNSEQWIVQEVFIVNGQEVPSGENFIESTLLDVPAETWQAKKNKEDEEHKKQLEKDIDKLRSDMTIIHQKGTVAKLVNKTLLEYDNINIEQLDTLFSFMAGEITHIVIESYGDYKILSLIDAVEDTNYFGGRILVEGLRLVSLFGCNNKGERCFGNEDKNFRLDWRINQYRDGSGSLWTTIYPCKSYDEAVFLIDKLIADKDATESLIILKQKYKLLNPNKEKIEIYRKNQIVTKKNSIDKAKSDLAKLINELKEIEAL